MGKMTRDQLKETVNAIYRGRYPNHDLHDLEGWITLWLTLPVEELFDVVVEMENLTEHNVLATCFSAVANWCVEQLRN